jgi:glycosyltransferase involved in cell wall biosynthesis
MTRVALIAGTYLPERCGVANYTARLCAALSEYCVKPVILTTYYAAEAAYDPNAIGVVHGWRLADLKTLARAVHETGADILHIQHAAGTYGFERAIFLLPLLLRATGWRGKIVTTVHEYGWWEWQPKGIPPQLMEWLKMWGQHRGWWDREDGFLLTLSDVIITTNADAEAAMHTRIPALADRLCHIPIAANVEVAPIDRALGRHLLRENCSWPEDSVVIAFFGFLHPVKGLETLLPAFKQVLATQPQARLLLIGGVESLALQGEDAKRYWIQLHALVAELGLSQVVHLTGYVSAETASHYLAGVDIGVLPFNHGLTLKSGSLLTLLAHGLPVVATQHTTSLPEGHPVRLVPPRDIDALTAGLLDLLNNPTGRSQLGEAGRAFIQNFNWQSIARAHLEVYREGPRPSPLGSSPT